MAVRLQLFAPSRLSTESFNKAHKIDKDDGGGGGCLKTRILKLVYPRRSATAVLQNWVEEGRGRIFTWMEAKERSRMSAADHALRLELTIKVHTVGEAEKYFENLPNTVSKKAASLPLLHSYVKERSTEKAESLMQKMNSLGLIVNPHPYNEMMKLYISTSQHENVLAVIVQMKQNRIQRTVELLSVLNYRSTDRCCSSSNW
ncbi:pentatricopeptide repeat-containing protein At5g27460-like [Coffea eugenioides]|uniref:pentatricopeptide repeat-containing protein At5g27460-like n=1 Tax=Coffea eugenioides TaxID=49369 RepID=UPI000F605AA8|nr:pentatricopeptide repeat-containing protein At5g27460-like [Coffea eugenioides]